MTYAKFRTCGFPCGFLTSFYCDITIEQLFDGPFDCDVTIKKSANRCGVRPLAIRQLLSFSFKTQHMTTVKYKQKKLWCGFYITFAIQVTLLRQRSDSTILVFFIISCTVHKPNCVIFHVYCLQAKLCHLPFVLSTGQTASFAICTEGKPTLPLATCSCPFDKFCNLPRGMFTDETAICH